MAKLVRDGTGEKFYESGVDHGVLFPQKDDGTYGKGVAWNGFTAVNETPEGAEPNEKYADNMLYAVLRSAERFGATIEAFMYPPEFGVCDGTAEIATGVYAGGQARKPFGFAYRTKIGNDAAGMDKGYKIHLVYNATAKPSEKNYETVNEDPDNITFSWELTTTPVTLDGYAPVSNVVIDSTKADATKLAALEALLYGGESADATLPLPAEVKSMMAAG